MIRGKGKRKANSNQKKRKTRYVHLIRLLLYNFFGLFIYILHFTIQYFRNFAQFSIFKIFYMLWKGCHICKFLMQVFKWTLRDIILFSLSKETRVPSRQRSGGLVLTSMPTHPCSLCTQRSDKQCWNSAWMRPPISITRVSPPPPTRTAMKMGRKSLKSWPLNCQRYEPLCHHWYSSIIYSVLKRW